VGAMIRATIASAIFVIASPTIMHANGSSLPAMPEWQTDATNCAWHWREGGRIGLWAETCRFNGTTWQVVWDHELAAFVTSNDEVIIGISVQAFALANGASITALGEQLIKAGSLDVDHECIWQATALRHAPHSTAFHVLTPSDRTALSPTVSGDIPEPTCGSYGVSTHGIRYFMTDLRWPNLAIFVDEGQERPMFDPRSITVQP
jgi:hypothetical protein